MVGKLVSKPYIAYNDRYLETEGPTDRRTRTSSVSHKKNATEAPNVSQVRKAGCHELTGDPRQTCVRSKHTMAPLPDGDMTSDVR